jgi:hypothetical protein
MLKIYVGSGLTQAPDSFRDAVDNLKHSLRAEGYEVIDFVGLVGGTPTDVYTYDLKQCVGECDAFVAICDYPSLGLGWELAEATRLGKPVLMLAHVDARITRLVIGAAEVEPNVRLERYAPDLPASVPIITQFLAL